LHVAKTVEDIGFYAGFVGKNLPKYFDFLVLKVSIYLQTVTKMLSAFTPPKRIINGIL
jgi:hypothetical protein